MQAEAPGCLVCLRQCQLLQPVTACLLVSSPGSHLSGLLSLSSLAVIPEIGHQGHKDPPVKGEAGWGPAWESHRACQLLTGGAGWLLGLMGAGWRVWGCGQRPVAKSLTYANGLLPSQLREETARQLASACPGELERRQGAQPLQGQVSSSVKWRSLDPAS